ncbi:hypothetical protein [Saccharopolyspora griseoalba]|uniref:Uncharacterized protein n=1 Tax=Saccharopolyspora griseoalba TaxID=1431848 RepID=A0ABW2LV53_9PSEU
MVVQDNWCELPTGHPGRHVTCLQDDDAGEGAPITWWAWWSGSPVSYDIMPGPTCGVGDEESICTLPTDHVGNHQL